MAERVIHKALITQEDLALGQGSVIQNRRGEALLLTKIDLLWIATSLAMLKSFDVTRVTHAIWDNGITHRQYAYDSTSEAVPDNTTVILPDSGEGRWVLRTLTAVASWGSITGNLADQVDLHAELTSIESALADSLAGQVALQSAVTSIENDLTTINEELQNLAPSRYTVVTITANLTLNVGHLGQIIYVPTTVTADLTVTIPTGLGNGFHCSFINGGTGTLEVIEDGPSLTLPAGGTGIMPADGRASIVMCEPEVYALIGLVNPA